MQRTLCYINHHTIKTRSACMHGDMNQAKDDQGYQFRILHFVACYNFRLHTLPRLYLGL